ncbi:CvfB family protein [Salisediminibacterium halotolerans]|uniref:CvfB family protein n=1 Tax=Salisediminibacterium halotolerans TaxID=517425 RepID=UPI000EACD1CA|nr:S1-like domain-containing RNA-binding protein [Salisediminibacterium halotolerans]RLJ81059.1 hypothetical protein BCL39_0120 [Actinophytocola xinjiangensis]RPE87851.1 hypothetical protein EDD67_1591 [Salisediminibacterium halotolerans]TWG37952.1 hypothetical protein BCL52_0120 [Salisediminibacterium halotolerans]GEL09026.1 hypothetical protein SHA02_24420 [Salisediminibacterium halotolerans]
MQTAKAGMITECRVEKIIETGYVLRHEGIKILLHTNDAIEPVKKGEDVSVFLYEDKQGNLNATMQIPGVTLDTYDWADVVHVHPRAGVFVDIGITKDILLSKDDLPEMRQQWPKAGDSLFVTLGYDRMERLVAKPVTEEIILQERDIAQDDINGQAISGQIYRILDEGAVFFSEQGIRGFIHESEANGVLRLGEAVSGRVIERKTDGTVNVTLRPIRTERQASDAEKIISYLEGRGGKMPLTDQSPPDLIDRSLGMSKGAFKRAIGKLLKEDKVEQQDGFTFLK